MLLNHILSKRTLPLGDSSQPISGKIGDGMY
jgi:hypothetical protein